MRARRIRATAAVALATVVSVVAGGCGGDEEGGPTAGATSFTVVGVEMAFEAPERVPAGGYDVTFRNDGTIVHELAFRDPAGQFVTRRSIAAGETTTMEVELEPGTWELGCFEPGHYEAGMHSLLVVEEPVP